MTEFASSVSPLVHEGARVGDGCEIGPLAIVEEGAVVGNGCVLEPFSRVCSAARLGDGVRLGQGAVVGTAPQHIAWKGELAPCRIGDNVRIGEYATVSGGMFGCTVVGDGCFLMAYSHVGHDAELEGGVLLANGVQLAGHVRVGAGANIGGGTLVHQHVRIGTFAFVAGGIRLEKDLAPWSKAMGEPPRWAGINRIALERAGWSSEQIQSAGSVLRVLFRSRLLLEDALARIVAGSSAEAAEMTQFCKEIRRGLLRPKR